MKNGLLISSLLFLLCSFTLTGDYTEVISAITSTGLPATAKQNKEIKFKITSELNNDCAVYSRQETNQKAKFVSVTIYGEYPTSQNCNKVIKEITTYFSFTPKSKGEYIFQFTKGLKDGVREYMTDTLVVK